MEELDRLTAALAAAQDYLTCRGEVAWSERMAAALDLIKRSDLSFVGDLYSRVADTCEIEDLFITDPQEHSPPLTETEANLVNDRFAEVINELSAALRPFWDREHKQ